MTTGYLLKKTNLSDRELDEIKAAVKKAESRTSGEIALALTAESDTYSFWELLAANYVAAGIFVCLLPFANEILGLYKKFLWYVSDWTLPAFYGIATLAAIVLGFFIMNIPVLDRMIIPKKIQDKAVTARAFRHFAESGVYETGEHSGILIFVSYLERQVRIIADSGIAEKIPQDLWNIIADDLAGGLKDGNTKDGFIAAVEKCGDLLAEHFPGGKDNPNELADGLVILGE